jgi:hypothetical protein
LAEAEADTAVEAAGLAPEPASTLLTEGSNLEPAETEGPELATVPVLAR